MSLHASAQSEQPFALHLDDTVVFIGDQFTQQGDYVEFVRAFVAVRYPELQTITWLAWTGRGGTAASMTDQVEAQLKLSHPSIAVICLGLNDARMAETASDSLAEDYRGNLSRLVDRLHRDRVLVWLVTPPPLDEPPAAETRLPLADRIDHLAEVVREVADECGAGLVDWHRIQQAEAAEIRKLYPGYRFADRPTEPVFPGIHGHATLAYALLRAWDARPIEFEMVIDWPGQQVHLSDGRVESAKWKADGLELELADVPMPWPLRSRARPYWTALELSQCTFRVEGLPNNQMTLDVSGARLPFSRQRLEAGLNLTAIPAVNGHRDLRALLEGLRLTGPLLSLPIEPRPPIEDLHEPYERMRRAMMDYYRAKGWALLRGPRVIRQLHVKMSPPVAPQTRPTTRPVPSAD
jgi:hypothetical protein